VGYFNGSITIDETWVNTYDPGTKQQSKEWRHNGSLRPQKSLSKAMASVFWDKDGIWLVEYMEKGETITAKYYVALLDKLNCNWSPNVGASFQKESCFFKTLLFLTMRPL
jgi:hypothetical protein